MATATMKRANPTLEQSKLATNSKNPTTRRNAGVRSKPMFDGIGSMAKADSRLLSISLYHSTRVRNLESSTLFENVL